MSAESLIDLSKTLSRKSRVDILRKLCMKSYRNSELSAYLHIGKERVSEALTDLVASRLVILFETHLRQIQTNIHISRAPYV